MTFIVSYVQSYHEQLIYVVCCPCVAKRISLLRVAKAEKHTANTVDESTLVSVPASKVQDTATDAVSAPAPATAENVAVDVPTVTADEPVKSSSPVPYTADDDDDDDEIDLT